MPRPSHRRPRRPGRRTILAVVAVTVTAVAAVVALTGRAEVDPRTADRDVATAALDTVVTSIAPADNLASALVTPTGDAWWDTVTGLAADLELGDGDTAPAGGRWYAHTTAVARAPQTDTRSLYDTIYVGFDTVDRARAWQPAGPAGTDCVCTTYRRGNVVAVLPPWVHWDKETFTPFDTPVDLTVTASAWTLDVDQTRNQQLAISDYADHLAGFYTAVGFGGADVTWSGTATSPGGPWTGPLAGFEETAVDLDAAEQALTSSVEFACDTTGSCNATDEGLGLMVDTGVLALTPDDGFGSRTLIPAEFGDAIDENVLLSLSLDPHLVNGLSDGSLRMSESRLSHLTYNVLDDGQMQLLVRLDHD